MNRRILVFAVSLVVMLVAIAGHAQEKFYESDGLKLRYWDEGEGEPVLLIHGSGVNGNLNWRAPGIQQALSEHYRVIMPDVRGHGKSEAPSDNRYGVAVVHDMVRLLDHLGINSAYVVGYSMGGMITIKLTTMFPERVRAALVGGMGWIEANGADARHFAAGTEEGRFAHSIRAFGEFGTTAEEMQAIRVPLKVIVGTKDPGQMQRVGLWRGIVPELDVLYVEGATHQGCVFRKELREGIVDFIDRSAGQASAVN